VEFTPGWDATFANTNPAGARAERAPGRPLPGRPGCGAPQGSCDRTDLTLDIRHAAPPSSARCQLTRRRTADVGVVLDETGPSFENGYIRGTVRKSSGKASAMVRTASAAAEKPAAVGSTKKIAGDWR